MNVRYVTDPNRSGWILAVPDGSDPGQVAKNPKIGVSLPWTLKVNVTRSEAGRDYFEILEGPLKGMKASLKTAGTASFLTDTNPQTGPGLVRLSRKNQQLWYGSVGPVSAFSEFSNPVPRGIHDLEIPDAPHEDYYPESSRYQQVWFRIGHRGDRYLHLGTISHGCATVRPWLPDPKTDARFASRSNSELGLPTVTNPVSFGRWDDLCRYLLPCRKGDSLSVGTLHVTD